MASQTPKSVSTRLLTMKFMQRAAATASSAPSTPDSGDSHSAKRRKTAGRHSVGTPETTKYATSTLDMKAFQAAQEGEKRKRQAAIDRQAEELGDSRWVLEVQKLPKPSQQNGTPLNIEQIGFAQIDSVDESEKIVASAQGKRKYYPTKGKNVKNESGSSSDSDSDSESLSGEVSSADHDSKHETGGAKSGTPKGPRSQLKTRRSTERAKAHQLAEQRRKKEVKLNQLTSISGFGETSRDASITCHRCGKQGHKQSHCPQGSK